MAKSNITVKSNIYPRKKGYLFEDKDFISKVRGRIALEKLIEFAHIKEYELNEIQRQELKNGLIKCIYNEEGDITNGIIFNEGKLKWGCRCENFKCKHFSTCRRDLSEEDIQNIIDVNIKNIADSSSEKKNDIDNIKIQKPLIFKNVNNKLVNEDISRDVTELENDKKIFSNKDENIKVDNIIDLSKYYKKSLDDYDNQKNVIEASPYERILVNAGPGTGKTYTLIERIKYLTTSDNAIDIQDMIILSFSRAAIAEINKRLKLFIGKEQENYMLNLVDIRTFDSFATYIIKEVTPELDLTGISYDERIEIAINTIKDNPEIFELTKHIIVDEIQDLVGVRARFVQTILEKTNCGFTLLGDLCQAIYDYQVKDKPIEPNSERFIKWIEDKYTDLKKIEFLINYRQKNKLDEIGFSIRRSIQTDHVEKQKSIMLDTLKKFRMLDECQFIYDSINEESLKKICFLCRTNGQALKVSKYLRDQGIEHKLQKPSGFKVLDRWIGEIFLKCGKSVISYDEFLKSYKLLNINSNYDIDMIWSIFKEIEGGRSSKINLNDLVSNLNFKKYMYDDLCIDSSANIIVSTIHRSKGREYNSVVLLDDFTHWFNKKDIDISDEMKVFYVAITRPKENIFRTKFKRKIFMEKIGLKDMRWIEVKFKWRGSKKRKKSITNIEVGKEYDIETTSFIDNNVLNPKSNAIINQNYILNNIKKNDPVTLKKNISNGKINYDIYHSGNIIGRMSSIFVEDIFEAYKAVHNVYTRDSEFFPDEINEVFIDEICTYLKNNDGYNLPDKYRELGMWNGVTLIGLGKVVWYKDN